MINPMTGKEINFQESKPLLTFHLNREEQEQIEQWGSDKINIVDCSDDLVDLLALPAAILVANPLEIDNDDLVLFNDWLSDNIDESLIILTAPFPIKANFTYLMYRNLLLLYQEIYGSGK